MGFEDDFQTSVISYPTFTELNAILSRRFMVKQSSLEYGMPSFIFSWPNEDIPEVDVQEAVFGEIATEAERLNVWPLVRWRRKEIGEYYVRFVPIQKAKKSDIRINYALFIATIAAVALGGFLQATSPVFILVFYGGNATIFDISLTTVSFVVALMAIIGTHEMGHYFMAKKRGIEATPPYFIPGLPQIGGTFGAFIKQKSPPLRKSDLFDLGVAGPIAGFVVTIIVLFVGFFSSMPVSAEQLEAINAAFPDMTGEIPVPILFDLMILLWGGNIPVGGTLFMHPVAFAAWVGMLVTALNLFPTGQLDGGHALRAIVDSEKHRYIGYGVIALMFLLQLYTMAILVLFLSFGGPHPGALNDTVPISKTRILLFVLCMVILVLCIPPLWQAFII